MPDDDETADKYLLADELLTAAGLGWYELSNWARDEAAQCRHNVLYWHSDDWFGIGPGAHSHVGGERWWNVKHPRAYAAGSPPRASARHEAREVLDAETAAGRAGPAERPAAVRGSLASDGLRRPTRCTAARRGGPGCSTRARSAHRPRPAARGRGRPGACSADQPEDQGG